MAHRRRSPASRRASGPTCGCAGRCSAPSDLVDVVAGRGPSASGPRRPRCATTRPGSSSSPSPGPASGCSSTAVGNEDEQPSVYLDLVDPTRRRPDSPTRCARTHRGRPHDDPAGLVGELRREVGRTRPGRGRGRPATGWPRPPEGVPGADPGRGGRCACCHDERPLRRPDEPVPVSPSQGRVLRRVRAALAARLGRAVRGRPSAPPTSARSSTTSPPSCPVTSTPSSMRRGRRALGPARAPAGLGHRPHPPARRTTWSARLARLLRRGREQGWERVGVELDMRVELGRAVAARPGRPASSATPTARLRVVDLKTGSQQADRRPSSPSTASSAPTRSPSRRARFARARRAQRPAPRSLQVGKGGLSGLKPSVQPQPPLAGDDRPGVGRGRWSTETAEGMGAARVPRHGQGTACETCPVRSLVPGPARGDAL